MYRPDAGSRQSWILTVSFLAISAMGASGPSCSKQPAEDEVDTPSVAKPVISYAGTPYTFTNGIVISALTPANTGGVISSCSASPALPTGLSLSSGCVISGAPSANSAPATYTITATNNSGDGITTVSLAVMNGDVAVNVNNANLYKLKASDGTVFWGPKARVNCGGIAVDQVDFGVYTGSTSNCGGGLGVYKFAGADGTQVWNHTSSMACGGCSGYYVGNGGIAVDTSSSSPGVVFAETGCYGNIGKVSLADGSRLFCNSTNDAGRPTIINSTGRIYANTNAGAAYNYNTIYDLTGTGTQTSATSCEGLLEANPSDGKLYRGGSRCGTTLYQMNTSSLGGTNWSMDLSGSMSNFDTLALQPWSGGYIYAGSSTDAKIVVINPATQTVVRTFTTAVAPISLAVNPAGGNVYVANGASHYVYAYSSTGTLLWTSPDLGAGVTNLAAPRNVVGGP